MSSTFVLLSSTLIFIQQQITRSVHSLFIIFDVTDCCLNVLLLSRRQFRISSYCTYFLAMSVFMIIHLSWGPGLYLYVLDHVDPSTTILVICKMRIYILQSTAMSYRWCLTAACFDRYALSAINVHLRNYAKVYVARRVVLVILIIWIVVPVHTLIFYNIRGNVCGIVYSSIAALYHSIFTTLAGAVLPTVIMITCALLIHHNLILKQQRRQVNASQDSKRKDKISNLQNRRDRQVLIMLLFQVLVYIILNAPLMIFYFYNAITLNIPNKSSDRLAIERLFFFLAELSNLMFPVSSFYLYTMVSRMFREEVMIMLRCIGNCKWSDNTVRIAPITNEIMIRTIQTQLSTSKVIPKTCYSNQEKLEGTNETVQ